MTAPLLSIRNLRVGFSGGGATVDVVRGVDLDLAPGEVLGVIGESGSGKTVTGMSILRLLPGSAIVQADRLEFQGQALPPMDDEAFRGLRGAHLAMVFQNPTGSFNPAKTIGWHLDRAAERLAEKQGPGGDVADATRRLAEVGIPDPERVRGLYPHQLSGGMLQRALIAMVLLLQPELIIADEPTTNLDNIVERQIIDLFAKLRTQTKAGLIFITHDMAIAGDLCDRIAIMYAGEIVEIGPADEIFRRPRHPYSQGLIDAALQLERGEDRLREIPGEMPVPGHLPDGCVFAPRCDRADEICRAERQVTVAVSATHSVRCRKHD